MVAAAVAAAVAAVLAYSAYSACAECPDLCKRLDTETFFTKYGGSRSNYYKELAWACGSRERNDARLEAYDSMHIGDGGHLDLLNALDLEQMLLRLKRKLRSRVGAQMY